MTVRSRISLAGGAGEGIAKSAGPFNSTIGQQSYNLTTLAGFTFDTITIAMRGQSQMETSQYTYVAPTLTFVDDVEDVFQFSIVGT